MQKIRPPKVENKVVIPFLPGHIRTLLGLCEPKSCCGLSDRALILTFVDTGVRLKEMWNVNIEDVDLDRRLIKVHVKGDWKQ